MDPHLLLVGWYEQNMSSLIPHEGFFHKPIELFFIINESLEKLEEKKKKKKKKKDTQVIGPWHSRSWSIGRTPLQTISALVVAKFGKTSPGQSKRVILDSIFKV